MAMAASSAAPAANGSGPMPALPRPGPKLAVP
jgi:hypothetical protein